MFKTTLNNSQNRSNNPKNLNPNIKPPTTNNRVRKTKPQRNSKKQPIKSWTNPNYYFYFQQPNFIYNAMFQRLAGHCPKFFPMLMTWIQLEITWKFWGKYIIKMELRCVRVRYWNIRLTHIHFSDGCSNICIVLSSHSYHATKPLLKITYSQLRKFKQYIWLLSVAFWNIITALKSHCYNLNLNSFFTNLRNLYLNSYKQVSILFEMLLIQ